MADGTYQAKVYEKQGGEELVVASGGAVTVEDGGAINLASGAKILATVTAGSTASAVIPPAGIATMASTGTALTFTMSAAPSAGDVLDVFCSAATSTGTCTLIAAAGVTFSSTAALRTLVFDANDSAAHLVAVSATQYAVIPNSTADVVPTST